MKALILPLLLAGCATAPLLKIETRTVYVPQPVACIDKAKVPPEPAYIGRLPDDARQAADILAASLTDARATIHELLALVAPCTTTNGR